MIHIQRLSHENHREYYVNMQCQAFTLGARSSSPTHLLNSIYNQS